MSELNNNLIIIDDDEGLCDVLSRALSRRDYTVYVAHSLAQSVELAHQHALQYAVIDLRIGQDSGLEAVNQMKTIHADMKIVVLTGYASIATAVEAIKLGAKHYLTKPAEVKDIIEGFGKESGDTQQQLEDSPMSIKRLEWEHLQKVLHEHDGNISAAARAMGMHRRTLQRKLQKKPVKH